jgi:hypothetical protein
LTCFRQGCNSAWRSNPKSARVGIPELKNYDAAVADYTILIEKMFVSPDLASNAYL